MATIDLPASPFPADWLFFHADRAPDAPAIADPTSRLSYGELAARVRALAGHLAARGIGPGSRVLARAPQRRRPPSSRAWPCNALGATSVEVNREWSAEIVGDIVATDRRSSGVRLGPRRATVARGARRPPVRPSLGGASRRTPRARFGARSPASRRRFSWRTAASIPTSAAAPPRPLPDLSTATGRRSSSTPRAAPGARAASSRPSATSTPTPAPSSSTSGSRADDRALLVLPALLLLRPERAPDPPARRRLDLPRRPLRLPADGAGGLGRRGLHGVRRRPAHLRDHPPPGGRRDARPSRGCATSPRPGAPWRPDTIDWVRQRLPAGAALRHVRADRGHGAPLLPAAGAGRGQGAARSASPSPASSSGSSTSTGASCRPARSGTSSPAAPTSRRATSTSRRRRPPSSTTAGSGPATSPHRDARRLLLPPGAVEGDPQDRRAPGEPGRDRAGRSRGTPTWPRRR